MKSPRAGRESGSDRSPAARHGPERHFPAAEGQVRGVAEPRRRRAATVIALAAAALLGLAPGLGAAGPAPPPRFKLTLTRPMLANGYVKLEPGDYDVAFEPSPAENRTSSLSSRGAARASRPRPPS